MSVTPSLSQLSCILFEMSVDNAIPFHNFPVSFLRCQWTVPFPFTVFLFPFQDVSGQCPSLSQFSCFLFEMSVDSVLPFHSFPVSFLRCQWTVPFPFTAFLYPFWDVSGQCPSLSQFSCILFEISVDSALPFHSFPVSFLRCQWTVPFPFTVFLYPFCHLC